MGLERRDRAVHGQHEVNPVGVDPTGEEPRVRPEPKVKSFEINKRLVYGAWEKVRANGGAPGVDAVSIERFAVAEADNLYKLWNRMSSGSYFPGPVRAVEIPKDHGPRSFIGCASRTGRSSLVIFASSVDLWFGCWSWRGGRRSRRWRRFPRAGGAFGSGQMSEGLVSGRGEGEREAEGGR
jgi:hypothetical protein